MTSGATLVAGVAGFPVRHSLSPIIHSAWIQAAGVDAAYLPFPVQADGFTRFAEGLRGGVVRGINVTIPFKQEALALADAADELALASGAANLLLFHEDGRIEARNTDGPGLLAAFAEQAPGFDVTAAPVVVLGAGGAARGAVAALLAAGAPEVRIVNRTRTKADHLAEAIRGARPYEPTPQPLRLLITAMGEPLPYGWQDMPQAFTGAGAVVNATAAGLSGEGDLADLPLGALPSNAVVMDMVYKPLRTGLLAAATASGRRTVDGLSMLINQAVPSFAAFYGRPIPPGVDVRKACLALLEARP